MVVLAGKLQFGPKFLRWQCLYVCPFHLIVKNSWNLSWLRRSLRWLIWKYPGECYIKLGQIRSAGVHNLVENCSTAFWSSLSRLYHVYLGIIGFVSSTFNTTILGTYVPISDDFIRILRSGLEGVKGEESMGTIINS